MEIIDKNQKIFENFEVPDPIRIKKAIELIDDYYDGKLDGLSVLECGIAKGGVADILSRRGAHCFGIDINPRSIDGVEIKQADLNEGFPNFSFNFDVIFAGEVMEHIFNDVQFINNCRNLLKRGGLIVLTVPNLLFSLNRLWMFFGRMPVFFAYAPYHYHFYNKVSLMSLLEKNGFEVLRVRSSHVLFSTRRNRIGRIFEVIGDILPSIGAHLIVCAKKR